MNLNQRPTPNATTTLISTHPTNTWTGSGHSLGLIAHHTPERGVSRGQLLVLSSQPVLVQPHLDAQRHLVSPMVTTSHSATTIARITITIHTSSLNGAERSLTPVVGRPH